jgi:carboxymethylenebutenolidase
MMRVRMSAPLWFLVAMFAVCTTSVIDAQQPSTGTYHVDGPHDASQDWAKANLAKSPRHGEYVSIKEPSGRVLQAWVVYPEVKDKAPVVVMIHEIFGLSDWAREMADEVAGAGYIVVEPDLLSGFGPPMSDMAAAKAAPAADPHAHMDMQAQGGVAYMAMTPGGTAAFPDQDAVVKAVSSLDAAQVTADLDAAADYGRKQPSASNKLYVAGFCWGGGKSFAFATHRKDLSAAFVFYGPPPPADAMKNIAAPVYGFYAGKDARISATIPQTETDMKAAGKKYEPVTYDGAGHGFMRAGEAPDASAENAAARAAGFRRLVDLLGGVR